MNTEQEPQAQAEPEVVATVVSMHGLTFGNLEISVPIGTELITLQSHREAIAKKDAALQACVELMQYMRSVSSFERNGEIDAAITQAEEAQG